MNCPVTKAPVPGSASTALSTTRANMYVPSKQRTYRCYHSSVTYVTQIWRSYRENFPFIVM